MQKYYVLFDEHFIPAKNNLEGVLKILRESGASQLECVKILRDRLKVTLSEADDYVLYSETWKDRREYTEELRNAFWAAFFGNEW